MQKFKPPYESHEALFREYFASNRGPGYELTVTEVSSDQRAIYLRVTFRSGNTYCCGEPGCHFGPNWQRLHDLAAKWNVDLSSPMSIYFHGVVQPGVRFELLPRETDGYDYHAVFEERS